MRQKHDIDSDDIQQQAAKWVACTFSGNASHEDEEALNRWLAADRRHKVEYLRILEIWDVSGDAAEPVPVYPSEQHSMPTQTGTAKRHSGVWASWLAVAAVVGILVFNTSMFVSDGPPGDGMFVQTFATDVGQTKELVLDDGSFVTLNTDTRLFVDFSSGLRRAILDSGEAYFEVTKDPLRPFVVTAGAQSVTVLGTKFNVHRNGQTLTVAVLEGVVAVHENIEPEKLEQNARMLVTEPSETLKVDFQHYRIEAGSVGTFEKSAELVTNVATTDTASFPSWRQGIVKFNNSLLSDVVKELGRYAPKTIEITDPSVADLNISGVFHFDDIEGILVGLEAMLPIKIIETDDQILIAGDPDSLE